MQLDPDEIRDYRQEAFFDKRESSEVDPFKIFLAVLAAILMAWFIRAVYVEWQIRQVLDNFNQQIVVMNAESQRAMELSQLRAKAAEDERTRIEEEKTYQQKVAKYQLEQNRQAVITNAINDKNRKVQAWDDYYKPAKGCESSNDNKDLMKCGNDYARAKKSFEAQWASAQSSPSN
ncbi:MAG: hypothetical protein PSV17_11300 [Methylotenera sp.]|uniref:hypothetical protein n=1 Tax=Methylotenera sp. TaxID=2051956 RepID=UPI0024873081|nr:hypothetical protein [Methylotenera sp.]MDI1309999.1 hypothetical protein [Methylotenera sp.]